MRLIRLKIKNIASLKGEHLIQFQDLQKESSLFAITGETGSGKSTILNAIGLALYGQVYKKNLNQLDVVTLGEKEGQIELIFQVKDKFYLATWKGKVLKQNGEPYSTPQPPLKEVYLLQGDDFNSSKTISDKKPEELLHLDFDQFCKCIILNQGEFARFLMSTFTERKEILEKLYPGEMLDRLSRELKDELDQKQKELQTLETEVSSLTGDDLNPDELKREQTTIQESKSSHEVWLNFIGQWENPFFSLLTYHQRFQENKKRIQQNKLEQGHLTDTYNQLLKTAELAAQSYDLVIDEYNKDFPRLQTLLIAEEKQKHLEDSLKEQQDRLKKALTSLQESERKIKLLSIKQAEWDNQNQKFFFHYPKEKLKSYHIYLGPLLDLYYERELYEQDLKSKNDKLSELETLGKDLKSHLDEVKQKLSALPTNLEHKLKELEHQKNHLQQEWDKKQKAEGRDGELKNQLKELQAEHLRFQTRKAELSKDKELIHKEISPLDTIAKLQHYIMAIETCYTHPDITSKGECPVCHTQVSQNRWQELKKSTDGHNFSEIQSRIEFLNRKAIQIDEEQKLITKKEADIIIQLQKSQDIINQNDQHRLKEIPLSIDLDKELQKTQKWIWESEDYQRTSKKLELDLSKAREQYALLKTETQLKKDLLDNSVQKFEAIEFKIPGLLPPSWNKSHISQLQNDKKNIDLYLIHETQGESFKKESEYFKVELEQLRNDTIHLESIIQSLQADVNKGKVHLDTELKGKTAQDLIKNLNDRRNQLQEEKNRKENDLKKQESLLKEQQSRLYSLEELARDFDLQFKKELHTLKDFGNKEMTPLNDELAGLKQRLADLAVDFTTPVEIIEQFIAFTQRHKEALKQQTQELQKRDTEIQTYLSVWDKRQEKLSVLNEKRKILEKGLIRLENLFQVLGKDELRTFVLSLVEENLILQTNHELQNLCSGRYEIIHQSKRMKLTPEFYVLDKFREGGLRKVSTLSGGETFMVSLAMALALAEMTRGQAEIDSLFIDEGFGTLDQDSLEDVLDMLKQIQTRGLMVGLISHIKTLTSSLPVNLLLNKKADGTSSISIQYN